MKNIIKTGSAGIVAALALTANVGCSDMMDMESERVLWADDNRLDNVNDSLYSAVGILTQIQRVADRMLLFGELRADLMTTTEDSHSDLKDIERFKVSADNQWADSRDFYQIINNCNFALARLDTSIVIEGQKALLPEYVAIKSLRAWTYVQMGLIYGKVPYATQPILTVDDSRRELPELTLDQLVEQAIADLEPYKDVRSLDYGSLDGHNTVQCFVPINMFLGDLYLYQNRYEDAAMSYVSLIDKNRYTVSRNGANYWINSQRLAMNTGYNSTYQGDVIFKIPFGSSLRAYHSQMVRYTYSEDGKPWLVPVAGFVQKMNEKVYSNSDNNQSVTQRFRGDLRGYGRTPDGEVYCAAYGPVTTQSGAEQMMITKFYNNLSGTELDDPDNRRLLSLPVYRTELLYLRLAEAINRLGKPTVAFAVLKYGLNRSTLDVESTTSLRIDPDEFNGEAYLTPFTATYFDSNEGVSVHGLGTGVAFDNEEHVIPELPTLEERIEYVEDCIMEEIAAENSFEGNRFFDLMLVSRHRSAHPAYMAGRVSRKYGDSESMRQHLMTLDNWFVKCSAGVK
ncbi:MAG: RagB/SusD family nutrient uptake outer membrane protein [Clostridium sp.]|nr:RagB/SusD family nutrient uptake outer membrane protein [Clostridium sp.]